MHFFESLDWYFRCHSQASSKTKSLFATLLPEVTVGGLTVFEKSRPENVRERIYAIRFEIAMLNEAAARLETTSWKKC